MVQTAYGSLTVGLDIHEGQTILTRGGTSSVGMAAAALEALGVDRVIIDDGAVAANVRDIRPEGVDAVLELVGVPTLPDSLAAAGYHGKVCTGMLSIEWIVPDFQPSSYVSKGVWLTGYGGNASDLPVAVLQEYLDAVAAGEATGKLVVIP
jgi:NADPH:quinone reductase-like Zn-dependent oxidoreductase